MSPESERILLAEIGSFLRECRESQGKTLDDAAAVTRIGKNYLIAIEEGEQSRFPSETYLKGFLRIYARYLGLSGEEIVAGHPWLKAPALQRPAEPVSLTAKPEGKQRSLRWWVIPLVLTILSAGVAYLMEKPFAPPVKRSTEEKKRAVSTPVQAVRTTASASLPPQPIPRNEPPVEAKPVENQPQHGSILRLKVNQDSSLNITIDDTISQPYELKAGDLIEWKAERGFVIDVSNAGGIEAEFNGRQLPPLGPAGKSAHLVLKSSEVSN